MIKYVVNQTPADEIAGRQGNLLKQLGDDMLMQAYVREVVAAAG